MADITYRAVRAGEVVFFQGDQADCAYVIESGEVEVNLREGDRVRRIALLGAGELLGEMGILDALPRSANAIARTDARLMVVERDQLDSRLRTVDPVLRLILDGMLARLRQQLHRDTHPPALQAGTASAAVRNDSVIGRIRLESELRAALASDELRMHVQPIGRTDNGCIAGFEALMRWHHPVRGMITPDAFIKVAEESGLIVPLGRWILHEACAAAVRFDQENSRLQLCGNDSFISVNVSGLQIYDPDFLPGLRQELHDSGLAPGRLKLEITESVLTNASAARQWISDCKALGVRIALDDFGTGYSSLSYLHDFEIDSLKIDQSFVRKMLDDGRSSKIVASVTTLAKALDLETIAEGVETRAQYNHLAQLGCDYVQGYLISRPMPVEDFFI